MSYAGQGRVKKLESNTTGKPERFIEIVPKFTWKVLPSVTQIPVNLPRGGIVIADKGWSLLIPGVGFGSGGFIPHGSGPVLLGGMGAGSGAFLIWIIIFLLVISAVVWAVTHLLIEHSSNRYFLGKSNKDSVRSKNWVETVIAEDQNVALYSPVNGNIIQKEVPLMTLNNSLTSPSLGSLDTTDTAVQKTAAIYMNAISGHSSPIKASIASYAGSTVASTILRTSPIFLSFEKSKIVESRGLGLIFTVSTSQSPNTWSKKDNILVNHLQPSPNLECEEVFLLNRERLVVGIMRNSFSPKVKSFIIEVWQSDSGRLLNVIPNNWHEPTVQCISVASTHDEFIAFINESNLVLWHLPSNNFVSIQLPFVPSSRYIVDIKTTVDGNFLVITTFDYAKSIVTFYAYDFDSLIKHDVILRWKTFSSNLLSFCYSSRSTIIIVTSSGVAILWNLAADAEIVLTENFPFNVRKFISTKEGNTVLLMTEFSIIVMSIPQWQQISQIPVQESQVCSVSVSCELDDECLVAVAYDTGTIHVYDTTLSHPVRVCYSHLPVVGLMFSTDGSTLVTMANKTSQHKVQFFELRSMSSST